MEAQHKQWKQANYIRYATNKMWRFSGNIYSSERIKEQNNDLAAFQWLYWHSHCWELTVSAQLKAYTHYLLSEPRLVYPTIITDIGYWLYLLIPLIYHVNHVLWLWVDSRRSSGASVSSVSVDRLWSSSSPLIDMVPWTWVDLSDNRG